MINLLVIPGSGLVPAVETGRTDISGIYIPDLIKVDLSTSGVRLAGGGPDDPSNPDDTGFSRLSIFGNDVLQSNIQDPFENDGFIAGGWPNGRRFGDDGAPQAHKGKSFKGLKLCKSCTRDGGMPSKAGLQGQALNNHELRW